ncbi:MAG TPA: DUF6537 domain-containing protein, partial [Planctomycetota bacterium]|nr:DUF6537 domain-containing protein [Planctomycetota bacterium]
AYKDEYEVARLHLKPWVRDGALRLFSAPERVTYHFHPPLLRALGMQRKLALGAWFTPVLGLLRAGRRLRGTPLDPFGHARVRREERALVGWYQTLLDGALARLTPASAPLVAEIAALPDLIRGYEDIKLRGVAAARAQAESLLARLAAPPAPAAP